MLSLIEILRDHLQIKCCNQHYGSLKGKITTHSTSPIETLKKKRNIVIDTTKSRLLLVANS